MVTAILAGTLKIEALLQLLPALGRQVEEVHVADSQLRTLGDFLQGSQLNPGDKDDQCNSMKVVPPAE